MGRQHFHDKLLLKPQGQYYSQINFQQLGTAFGVLVNSIPNTSWRLEAGSVLINSTFFPLSANATAVAHAVDVFPTPPFPVKNKNCVPI